MRSRLSQLLQRIIGVLHRIALVTDRAIRRLEDRHRGELPYMRRRENQEPVRAIDLVQTLKDSEAAARSAERAALAAIIRLGDGSPSATIADQLKAYADDAAEIATAYDSLRAEVVAAPPIKRAEPVWAGGLTARLSAFADACDAQAACDQARSTMSARSAMISVS